MADLSRTDAKQVEKVTDGFLQWCSTATYGDRPFGPEELRMLRDLLNRYRLSIEEA